MKQVYPIVLKKDKDFFVANIPNFNSGTQGKTVAETIDMARDAICMLSMILEDNGKELPKASELDDIKIEEGDIKTLVDVDVAEYRRRNDLKTVKKNCTVPAWLCYEAKKNNINFSAILQRALKEELGILG